MALPYYVEPEYWEEGYAVGDAKIADATAPVTVSGDAAARVIYLGSIAASVAASVSASAQIIYLGAASGNASATASTLGQRILLSGSTSQIALNATVKGRVISTASAFNFVTADASARPQRARNTSSAFAFVLSSSAKGNIKWSLQPDTGEIWTEQNESAETLRFYVEPGYWFGGYATGDSWIRQDKTPEDWTQVA